VRVRSLNAPDETACVSVRVRARYVYRPRRQLVYIIYIYIYYIYSYVLVYIHTHLCILYMCIYTYAHTMRATAADRDGGNAMTILRPLSVMTPGPGDPEVAYAKQGTSAAREPVCGCTYMDKSRRQCTLYTYIKYYIIYVRMRASNLRRRR